jgi:hypothetical protein
MSWVSGSEADVFGETFVGPLEVPGGPKCSTISGVVMQNTAQDDLLLYSPIPLSLHIGMWFMSMGVPEFFLQQVLGVPGPYTLLYIV